MLRDCRLVAFAAMRESERKRRFYVQVLGLTMVRDEPFCR